MASDDTLLPSTAPMGTGGLEGPGAEIGPYKLISQLGEGGFGTVWLAERRQPFVQRVALKIIKPGMDSKAVIARFEQERQALAVMAHPGIARVLDGGLTAQGRPYFVMEYVRGKPITEFADDRRLPIRDRLALFAEVCEAVQHAHLKGIIHRDLKPSNILAFDVEGGAPGIKVIDFGVAKATQHTMAAQTVFTETGQMIGTPEYMSPEQADPSGEDIDTRSDVYSLGVILYELLAGVTPIDPKLLRAKAYREQQRLIAEGDLPTPSTRLSTVATKDTALASRIGESRREALPALLRHLRRELEWIPLKAMRRERQERYQSATDLARDIRNYLEGRPLAAGPEAAAYRVRKFVRRHRGAVLAGSAVAASLVLGLGLALWQWREAAARERETAAALARAEAMQDFVLGALQSADPTGSGSQATTILDAMRTAAAGIDEGRFAGDPATEAMLRDAVGMILLNNGDLVQAERLLASSLRMHRELHREDHPRLATALNNESLALDQLGRTKESIPLLRESLEMRRRLGDGQTAELAVGLTNLASSLAREGSVADAEAACREALAIREARVPRDEEAVARSRGQLAQMLARQGRLDDAETFARQSLDAFRRAHPGDHPMVAGALNTLGFIVHSRSPGEESARLFQETLEMRRRIYRGDHPDVATSMNNLAHVLDGAGRRDEAAALREQVLEMRRRLSPGDGEELAQAMANLAGTRRAQGRTADAIALTADALAMRRRVHGDRHAMVALTLNNLAILRLADGQREQARQLAAEAVSIAEAVLPAGNPAIGQYRATLERCSAAPADGAPKAP